MLTRRDSIVLLGAAGAAAISAPATASPEPGGGIALAPERQWLRKLGENLEEEFDYSAAIEGAVPEYIRGTLYRNGPGIFERGGYRKWSLLDGDGMIRAVTFDAGQARFRNRFVRTAKYQKEQSAGRFLHPTWTTPAPLRWQNMPGYPSHSQAGVSVVVKNGCLYAFDEVGAPYVLDPDTLATLHANDPRVTAGRAGPANYKAHTKTDAATGAWVLIGCDNGARLDLQLLINDAQGRPLLHTVVPNPRKHYTYYHDFFWAGRYAVFHLHPAFLSPLPMLLGERPFVDSLSWAPEQGGMLVIVDARGERPTFTVDVPAVWMWHSANAYVTGNTLVADFIGYNSPDHFLGPNAALRNLMRGQEGVAREPGTLQRFTVDLDARSARLDTVAEGHFEFPVVHPARVGQRYRHSYAACGNVATSWFHDGVASLDVDSGACSQFNFGDTCCVSEPVFVPDPAIAATHAADAAGSLLCDVLDGATGKSFVAIFDAASVSRGPVAKIHLRHHLPMSFHGWWAAA